MTLGQMETKSLCATCRRRGHTSGRGYVHVCCRSWHTCGHARRRTNSSCPFGLAERSLCDSWIWWPLSHVLYLANPASTWWQQNIRNKQGNCLHLHGTWPQQSLVILVGNLVREIQCILSNNHTMVIWILNPRVAHLKKQHLILTWRKKNSEGEIRTRRRLSHWQTELDLQRRSKPVASEKFCLFLEEGWPGMVDESPSG